MSEKRPLIILLGGISLLFSSFAIVLSISPVLVERLDFDVLPIPFFSYDIIQTLLYIILLIASYGFLKLKKWGYWIMVAYDIFYLLAYAVWCLPKKHIPLYIQLSLVTTSFGQTFIHLIFVLITTKYFYKEK